MKKKPIWRVKRSVGGGFYAELSDGSKDMYLPDSSHCLACAKLELLRTTNYRIDARGWYKQGMCGQYLKMFSQPVDEDLGIDETLTDKYSNY